MKKRVDGNINKWHTHFNKFLYHLYSIPIYSLSI